MTSTKRHAIDEDEPTRPDRRAVSRAPRTIDPHRLAGVIEINTHDDAIGPPGMVRVVTPEARFWIDVTEVTNVDYARFVRDGGRPPAHWDGARPPVSGLWLPVVGVSLVDALLYAEWAGKRIPTRREWLVASRGPDGEPFPWGAWDPERCNGPDARLGTLTRVDRFPAGASPAGALDLVGNVREWVTTGVGDPEPPRRHAWVMGGSYRWACVQSGGIAISSVNLDSRILDVGFRCVTDE